MTRTILDVQDLWVGVGPDAACQGVSLTVRAGEVVAVLGGPGAGKSQLLRCIGLDFAPSSGAVLLRGVDVAGATGQQRRELRSRSIELVHPPAPHGEPDTTIPGARSGVLPHGPKAMTVPVAGMRQRIQIAKGLSHRSDVLLLDEPFTGVEHGVRLRILELLHRLRHERRAGVVIATRDPELVELLADQVVVLERGAVVEHGAAVSVLDAPQHDYTKSLVQERLSA